MLCGRLRLPGLLFLLLASLAGCTSAEAGSRPSPVGVAEPSYTSPADAPAFCAELAEGTDLRKVPGAMGTLAVTPDDVQARLHLGNAGDEVRDLLAKIDDDGHTGLRKALDELATALENAQDGTLTGAVRDAVVSALDEVGDDVQPDCRFPS